MPGGRARDFARVLTVVGAALVLACHLGCHSDSDSRDSPPSPTTPPVAAATVRGRLLHPRGEVMVKRAAADDWVRASDQMALYENDQVRTAGGAAALVSLQNGSTVSVGADALVGIAETHPRAGQDRTDVTIRRGHVDAALEDPAKGSLSVSTPAASVRAGREIVFQ